MSNYNVLSIYRLSLRRQIALQQGMKLRRYLAARLRNAADVPDLVQEVFLRMLRVERHESIRNPEA